MTVAVVGGGIGGLTTAIACSGRDLDVTVFEQAEALRPIGAGIGLAPNAMAILDRLDLAQAVETAGVPIQRTHFQMEDGKTLLEYDLESLAPAVRHPLIMIRRSALQEILVDALPDEHLQLGRRCTGVKAREDGATVQFSEGEVSAEIVVGADGIGSVVREFVDPDQSIRHTDHTTYRGIAPVDGLPRTGREIWGRQGRVGFAPIEADAVYWYVDVRDAPQTETSDQLKRALGDRYRTYPDPTATLIDRTAADDILRTEVTDLEPPDGLWNGRVALVGDAAHAATPDLAQGAAQAIEDGAALAIRLARHASPAAAFGAYETVRLGRVRRIVRDSRRFRRISHLRQWPAPRLRNALVRMTPAAIASWQFRRTFTPAI